MPVIYMDRVRDDDGLPLCYRLSPGPDPLHNDHDRQVYAGLPDAPNEFQHKDIASAFGGSSGRGLQEFINRVVQAGLLVKLRRGYYTKGARTE
jgi:hypothetical protein